MGAEIKKVISQALITKIALLKINGPPIKKHAAAASKSWAVIKGKTK